jgi:hypothetical protein
MNPPIALKGCFPDEISQISHQDYPRIYTLPSVIPRKTDLLSVSSSRVYRKMPFLEDHSRLHMLPIFAKNDNVQSFGLLWQIWDAISRPTAYTAAQLLEKLRLA